MPSRGSGGTIAVEEGRAPPLALSIREGGPVAQEAPRELSGTIGPGNLVGNTVVQIVGALAPPVGGPCRAQMDIFAADLDHRGPFMADLADRLPVGARPGSRRVDANGFGRVVGQVLAERGDQRVLPQQVPRPIVVLEQRRIVAVAQVPAHRMRPWAFQLASAGHRQAGERARAMHEGPPVAQPVDLRCPDDPAGRLLPGFPELERILERVRNPQRLPSDQVAAAINAGPARRRCSPCRVRCCRGLPPRADRSRWAESRSDNRSRPARA